MRGARPAGAAARRAVTRAAADAEARKVRRFMGGLIFEKGDEARAGVGDDVGTAVGIDVVVDGKGRRPTAELRVVNESFCNNTRR
jgi:hypothetical protein